MKHPAVFSRRAIRAGFRTLILLLIIAILQPLSVNRAVGQVMPHVAGEEPSDTLTVSKGLYYLYVLLNWIKHPEGTHYEFYRRPANTDEEWEKIYDATQQDNPQLKDQQAEPGVLYEYEVRVFKFDAKTKEMILLGNQRDTGFRKTNTLDTPAAFNPGDPPGQSVIRWASVARAEFYHLQVVSGHTTTTAREGQYTMLIDEINEVLIDEVVRDTQFTIDWRHIPSDAVCYWRVRAENDREVSEFTEFRHLRRPDYPIYSLRFKSLNDLSTVDKKYKLMHNEINRDSVAASFRIVLPDSKYINYGDSTSNINDHPDAFISVSERKLEIADCTIDQPEAGSAKSFSLLLRTPIPNFFDPTHNSFRIYIHHDKAVSLRLFEITDARGAMIYQLKDVLLPAEDCLELWKGAVSGSIYHYRLHLQREDGLEETFQGKISADF